jgi:hypothetical protein
MRCSHGSASWGETNYLQSLMTVSCAHFQSTIADNQGGAAKGVCRGDGARWLRGRGVINMIVVPIGFLSYRRISVWMQRRRVNNAIKSLKYLPLCLVLIFWENTLFILGTLFHQLYSSGARGAFLGSFLKSCQQQRKIRVVKIPQSQSRETHEESDTRSRRDALHSLGECPALNTKRWDFSV